MANDNQQEVIKYGHRQEEKTKKRIINWRYQHQTISEY